MDKEKLMEIGLTEEQAGAVLQELYSNYVAKAQLDEAGQTVKALKADLLKRERVLSELKKADAPALKQELEQLQKENKAIKEEYEEKLRDLAMTDAIKLSIAGKAQDADLVAGLFDKAKLTVNGDGGIDGLEEQLKALQESKPFLFKTGQAGYSPVSGAGSGALNPWQKETFNLTEQGRIFRENPAQAQELMAAAGIQK